MLVMGTTKRVGEYLKETKTNLSELSKITGISYGVLYASVWDGKRIRELRTDEFLSICQAIGVEPRCFIEKEVKQKS